MTALAAVLGTLVVLLVGYVAATEFRRSDRLLRNLYVNRVVVTLHSGEGFAGLLVDSDSLSLRFAQVEALTGSARTPVDGELIVPRGEVLYLQRP